MPTMMSGYYAIQNQMIFVLVLKEEQENILKQMIFRADHREYII